MAVALGLWGGMLAGCGIAPVSTSSQRSAAVASAPIATASAHPASGTATVSTTASSSTTPQATASATSTTKTCPSRAKGFVTTAPGKGRTVALTFDDGPGPADRQIVQILNRYKIHATFFLTGAHAAARPELVKLLADNGEVLADHTWSHQYPRAVSGGWSVRYLTTQITRTNKELSATSGQKVCFFRPPGGFRTNVLSTMRKLKLSAVLWSIDSEDWQQPNKTTKAATRKIIANATATGGRRHPILLMHSSKASHESNSAVSSYRGNTVAALPKIITWYQRHGYRFVTLDQKR